MSEPFTLRPVGNPLDGLFHLEGPRVAIRTLYGYTSEQRNALLHALHLAEESVKAMTAALSFYADRANHMDADGPEGESRVYQDCGVGVCMELDVCEDCGSDMASDPHEEDCPRHGIDTGCNQHEDD